MGKKKNDSMGIKSWAEEDRPREKLVMKGVEALTDAELLAILIRSGNANDSAVALAQKILSHYDNDLNTLARATTKDLENQFKGIGEAKAVTVVAALEIGRRRKGVAARKRKSVRNSEDLYECFATLADLSHEEFWMVLMNNRNMVVSSHKVGQGGFDATLVDVRVLMKIALENAAPAMAVCHNHPSGSMKPSAEDLELTNKIKSACKLMNIRLLDHLIVSGNEFFSFSDNGLL